MGLWFAVARGKARFASGDPSSASEWRSLPLPWHITVRLTPERDPSLWRRRGAHQGRAARRVFNPATWRPHHSLLYHHQPQRNSMWKMKQTSCSSCLSALINPSLWRCHHRRDSRVPHLSLLLYRRSNVNPESTLCRGERACTLVYMHLWPIRHVRELFL